MFSINWLKSRFQIFLIIIDLNEASVLSENESYYERKARREAVTAKNSRFKPRIEGEEEFKQKVSQISESDDENIPQNIEKDVAKLQDD